jgi:hypothetical protein
MRRRFWNAGSGLCCCACVSASEKGSPVAGRFLSSAGAAEAALSDTDRGASERLREKSFLMKFGFSSGSESAGPAAP